MDPVGKEVGVVLIVLCLLLELIVVLFPANKRGEVFLPDPALISSARKAQHSIVFNVIGVFSGGGVQVVPDRDSLLLHVVLEELLSRVGSKGPIDVVLHEVGQLTQILEVKFKSSLVLVQHLREAVQEQKKDGAHLLAQPFLPQPRGERVPFVDEHPHHQTG